MVFPVVLYGCESWTLKKADGQRIDAFELWCWRRHLRVPWRARRPTHSILENQPWMFFERTDAEAEAPIIWPPDMKSWLIGKDPDTRKVWGQEEEGSTENEMVGWHHWLNGHESEQTLRISEGRGSLVCCSPCGHKESDTTEWLNNNKISVVQIYSYYDHFQATKLTSLNAELGKKFTGASHKPVKPVVAHTEEGLARHGPYTVQLIPSSL